MTAVLEVRDLSVAYRDAVAVQNVSFAIEPGTTLGLVGESGSGKSTLAKAVVGMLAPAGGEILLSGTRLSMDRTRAQRRAVQMVHQDPYASLNPRMTVRQMLAEALRFHRIVPREAVAARCAQLMEQVRLDADALDRYPREFSGGQRQRIALARALSVNPTLLVADEPTSALDVSVQATVLTLLTEIQQELGLTMLFISHDLGVINATCDTVAVMQKRRLVEIADRASFFRAPKDPYSRALLRAVPRFAEAETDAP